MHVPIEVHGSIIAEATIGTPTDNIIELWCQTDHDTALGKTNTNKMLSDCGR